MVGFCGCPWPCLFSFHVFFWFAIGGWLELAVRLCVFVLWGWKNTPTVPGQWEQTLLGYCPGFCTQHFSERGKNKWTIQPNSSWAYALSTVGVGLLEAQKHVQPLMGLCMSMTREGYLGLPGSNNCHCRGKQET